MDRSFALGSQGVVVVVVVRRGLAAAGAAVIRRRVTAVGRGRATASAPAAAAGAIVGGVLARVGLPDAPAAGQRHLGEHLKSGKASQDRKDPCYGKMIYSTRNSTLELSPFDLKPVLLSPILSGFVIQLTHVIIILEMPKRRRHCQSQLNEKISGSLGNFTVMYIIRMPHIHVRLPLNGINSVR